MKLLLFANTDWYLYNFRLPLARRLRDLGHQVILVSPPGDFSSRLVAEGFDWIEFQLSRKGTNLLAEIFTVLRLYQMYRATKPDLVHHFTIKCVLYGGIVARVLGIPQVAAITGTGHVFTSPSLTNSFLRPLVSVAYKISLQRSDVIFQNPDDQKAFINLGLVKQSQSHLIRGSGVDVLKFRQAPPSSLTERPTTVVMICRLLREKGVAEFVEAARIVRRRMPKVAFKIAGEVDPGNPSSISTDQVSEWAAEGNAQFLGHVDNVASLLEACDVAALPTYYGEGVPRGLIEAAAAGLPIVTTDMPGCREICRHGENGYLIAPRDPEALAEAIFRLVGNRPLAQSFGARSREIAVSDFSEPIVLERTIDVYSKALADLNFSLGAGSELSTRLGDVRYKVNHPNG
ncbi:MAG: glycosyltransferase family 4 protein [Betaproteobacteria bacterium]|nr:glycosyltransferase family 4 protein [Betaproteobacteria bacterium]